MAVDKGNVVEKSSSDPSNLMAFHGCTMGLWLYCTKIMPPFKCAQKLQKRPGIEG